MTQYVTAQTSAIPSMIVAAPSAQLAPAQQIIGAVKLAQTIIGVAPTH